MRPRLRAWLAKPATLVVCAVLGVALCAPALGNNLQGEDYGQRAAALRAPFVAPLYAAGRANPLAVYQLVDRGALPWITHPKFHVAFLRPLGSLSLHVDYRFWPERPRAMFAHSLLWLALLLGATVWLYRRIVRPEWAAGLAALLASFDDVHGAAIAWLAARHALVAGAAGVIALALHDRWRRDGWKPGAFLAPLALLVALLAGEIGTGAVAYLFAHALFLDPAPWRSRFRAAAGWLSVVALWAVLYFRSGAGAYGSGLYLHPVDEPLVFVTSSFQRFVFLFNGLFWAPSADLWPFVPPTERARFARLLWIVALSILGLIAPLARRDRALRFWLCGALLSMAALCSAPAADRNSIFPALGSMAVIATVIARIADRDPSLPRSRIWRWPALGLAAGWVLFNLVFSPLLRPLRATALRWHNESMSLAADDLVAGQGQQLIVVNAADYYTGTMAVAMGALGHPPGPACSRVLYGGLGAIEVSRPDPFTLLIRAPGGFLENELNRVFRGQRHPLRAGDGLQLTQLLIKIDADQDGDPRLVSFHFSVPLEHPALRWVTFQNGRFLPFTPPLPGRSLTIAPPIAPIRP